MKKINILSLDGGGSRGTALIEQLVHFEKKVLKKKLNEQFDLFSGTSTGGIIATLLSVGYSASEIKKLYVNHGPKIFEPSFFRKGFFRSKYKDEYFNKVLNEYLQKRTLNSCEGMLIVPAYNVSLMDKVIFKSMDKKDANFTLFDVVRSTASAPTFFDPHVINSQVYVDGGLVINNPSMVCFIEAIKMGYDEVNIMSFGTGRKEIPISKDKLEKGLLRNAEALFDISLNEQSQTTTYFLQQIYEVLPILVGKSFGTFCRAECVIREGSGEIDDFSEKNIKAMIEDGYESYLINEPLLNYFKSKVWE